MADHRAHGRRSPSTERDGFFLPSYPSLKKSLSATSSTGSSNPRSSSRNSYLLPARSPRSQSPLHGELQSQEEGKMGHTTKQTMPPSFNIEIPRQPPAAEAALTALKYLPTPLLVLSSTKTVILANEAMGRLLGFTTAANLQGTSDLEISEEEEDLPSTDILRGQTLSQLGIDVVQDGSQIWVSWAKFLDGLADEFDPQKQKDRAHVEEAAAAAQVSSHFPENKNLSDPEKETPRELSRSTKARQPARRAKSQSRAVVHDAVVNVIISPQQSEPANSSSDQSTKSSNSDSQIYAKMIVSIWALNNQRYFNLTFTNTFGASLPSPRPKHLPRHQSQKVPRTPNLSFDPPSNSSSPGSSDQCQTCGSTPTSNFGSPSGQTMTVSPFPPMSAPGKIDTSSPPAVLHKLLRMKDAIINSIDIPLIAMWRDESLSIPNKAALKMMCKQQDLTNDDNDDLLSRFRIFDDKFDHELDREELPMVKLCRTQKRFNGWKIGVLKADGEKSVWECNGDGIYDEKSGEFLGGIVHLKDVTKYEELIKTQNEENEQQFQLICEAMPQMLWTTTPEGYHDWFSKRWYDYTGLTVDESMGMGWQLPFHPDDMPATKDRWTHSLATGDEYSTEYRCKSKDGEWRWMLGRAKPLRDPKTGKILKWFGSCTDIHDVIEARRIAKENREQLRNVIKHAKVTVWVVNSARIVSYFEGQHPWLGVCEDNQDRNEVGRHMHDTFGDIVFESENKGSMRYDEVVESLLSGKETQEQVCAHYVNKCSRWVRTRFVPMIDNSVEAKMGNSKRVTGVVGISFDFTEIKAREEALEQRKKENMRLVSAETAAKEASRLKSQFLANMSHEIRTPIAGVIGMAELLIDTSLAEEQKEFVENIQRSANGLLTVINDILDLSKVESGRLDIEEVQFSLSVVLHDVCKMMAFAAERKNLSFESDITSSLDQGLNVMGDPGRVRQILTNLLTNSIKFTSQGFVRLAVSVKEVKADRIAVSFVVEDTGIGIEEIVRRRLFKPFSQADSSTARRFGGTGLGLTICKDLVELMRGEITLESELDRGTKATFWIPFNKPQYSTGESDLVNLVSIPDRLQSEASVSGCSSEARTSGTPPKSPYIQDLSRSHRMMPSKSDHGSSPASSIEDIMPEVDRQSIHILVVEDNAINQQIAIKTIEKLGFSTNAVWNGKEALEYLLTSPSKSHPRPDIVLMDVQMPILDGYRATHLIRHHKPYCSIAGIRSLPIVAMTASAIQGDREKCTQAGMDDYLAKPVRGKTLESMLLKWALESKARANEQRDKRLAGLEEHDETCPDMETSSSKNHWCSEPSIQSMANRLSNHSLPSESDEQSMDRNTELNTEPGEENEGDRGMVRVHAEEKAASLRDNKLLAASDGPVHQYHFNMAVPPVGSSARSTPPSSALTEENMSRLVNEHEAADRKHNVHQGQHPIPSSHQSIASDRAVGSSDADRDSELLSDEQEPTPQPHQEEPPFPRQPRPSPQRNATVVRLDSRYLSHHQSASEDLRTQPKRPVNTAKSYSDRSLSTVVGIGRDSLDDDASPPPPAITQAPPTEQSGA